MAALVKVGDPYRATYSLMEGEEVPVTAKVQEPGGQWEDLPLSEVATPVGHDRLFLADYVPAVAGWYVVSFDTDPSGGDSVVKFQATTSFGDSAWATFAFGVASTEEV